MHAIKRTFQEDVKIWYGQIFSIQFVRRLSRDLQTSAILETSVFDFRCLLSATSEPHRLPACLPCFLSRDSEVSRSRPSVPVRC